MIEEEGSELASELWNGAHPVASSILSYPEGRAAIAAARRGGRLSRPASAEALTEFEQTQGEIVLIGVDEVLAREAGGLADDLGLRGYDAVHLASSLAVGAGDGALITWDADLRAAAEQMGMGTGGG